MKKNNFSACEQCGGHLEYFKEGSAEGVRCQRCGRSLVTTHIADIKLDTVEYEVFCRGDYKNKAHIRAVSEVAGCNFIMARKKLQSGLFFAFSGQALDTLHVRNIFIAAGMYCVISPDFKWD